MQSFSEKITIVAETPYFVDVIAWNFRGKYGILNTTVHPIFKEVDLMSSYVTRKTPGDTAWFTHDRFGMFIHWGLYAMPARHEWVKHAECPTEEKYDKYFKYFNPDLYDAKEWARQAKAAGMKYAIENNYDRYNFYGITGDFNEKTNPLYGLYSFKRDFGGYVVEFMGEFDLVINKPLYWLYKMAFKTVKKLKHIKMKFSK